ncbi:unnamed protein product [Paramecium octaurelia]|uniref:Uncharacterized protein n=1 Tax=Paramecium octaurelia TaxID=43137 RepID=A0A8S1U4G3_PAROT|nr:unnamed protein product [Paramecium octaurelia]
MSEEFQNYIFKDIDKGLHARKNQVNRDKVDVREKKQIAEYKNDLTDSEEEGSFSNKKNKVENKKRKKNHTNLIILLMERNLKRKLKRTNLLGMINHLIQWLSQVLLFDETILRQM